MSENKMQLKDFSQDLNAYLGKKCRELRVKKNITIAEMAKDLNFSFSALCQFETNKRCISISKAMLIFDYLDVDCGEIISRYYKMHFKK